MTAHPTQATEELRAARDFLLEHREDYATAVEKFEWPRPRSFNWGLEWFDVIATERPDQAALTIVEEDGTSSSWTYEEMSRRSDQVAGWLRANGVERGHRIVLMLGNQVELWEIVLAAIKLGAVLIPASTLLTPTDLADRVLRGGARFVVARDVDAMSFRHVPGTFLRIAVGRPVEGWIEYDDTVNYPADEFVPDGVSLADDPLLLYFTSGTTALPKLVEHSQISYPIGHLTTMYWIGLRPGDVHLNISSPGWAKHAWSNVFAPWLAGATVLVYNFTRLDPVALRVVLGRAPTSIRECLSAGEPLNPEVIERVRDAWGITIRDGYGQTETSAQIGNPPGLEVHLGSMGRPLPGYVVTLVDPATGEVRP